MSLATSSRQLPPGPFDPEYAEGEKIPRGHPLFGIVWMHRSRVSGAPCFYQTRVPVRNLFDSLEAGESLDEFLDGFEGVSPEQAQVVLRLASDRLLRDLVSV